MAYAIEGCTCAGQTYNPSTPRPDFCCAQGFSNEECPETLAEEAKLESLFGSTKEEIVAELVEVELQGRRFAANEKIAPLINNVNAKIKDIGYAINEPVGCFNWRTVSNSRTKSLHAFAIAIDINPSTNPSCGVTQACKCNNSLITDMPPEFVNAFKSESFDWGGDWVEHPDPMHFEWNGWRQ